MIIRSMVFNQLPGDLNEIGNKFVKWNVIYMAFICNLSVIHMSFIYGINASDEHMASLHVFTTNGIDFEYKLYVKPVHKSSLNKHIKLDHSLNPNNGSTKHRRYIYCPIRKAQHHND